MLRMEKNFMKGFKNYCQHQKKMTTNQVNKKKRVNENCLLVNVLFIFKLYKFVQKISRIILIAN